jgi:hypothetical protein
MLICFNVHATIFLDIELYFRYRTLSIFTMDTAQSQWIASTPGLCHCSICIMEFLELAAAEPAVTMSNFKSIKHRFKSNELCYLL